MLDTNENHKNKMNAEVDPVFSVENQLSDADVAHYVVDLLDDHAQHLTAVTAKRLLVARNLAVRQMVDSQAVQSGGHTLAWFGDQLERHRTVSAAIILCAILLAFYTAQQFGWNANLEDSDAFLLASDLPPEAYADKGFDTWLVSKSD
ncbi:MAG: hypothetical protein RIS87_148 [Pseudomonadota bacterium]|jgi:hypothetical protein